MKYPIKVVEDKPYGRFASHLVKTIGVEIKPEPTPMEPEIGLPPPVAPTPPTITCHSTTNYVNFSFDPPQPDDGEWVTWSEEQRYAIKVGDEIYNGDHSISVLGQQFELCGRTFSIPHSSGPNALIYVDDYIDDTPLKVTFIPSGVSEYDTIYSVNEGRDVVDCEVEYIDKDTEFSVCLKPDKVDRLFTCEMATNTLVLDYSKNPDIDKTMYVTINGQYTTWYDPNDETRTQCIYDYDYDADRPIKGWLNGVMVGGKLILTFETNIEGDSEPYKIVIDDQSELIASGEVVIETGHNPSAYYNVNKGTIQACLKPVPPTVADEDESTPGGGVTAVGYHRYRATHDSGTATVMALLKETMAQSLKIAKEDWDNWYASRQHVPEYKFEPTQVSYFTVKIGDDSWIFSNHIRYTRKDEVSVQGGDWTWHELIGNGQNYYLMKDREALLADDRRSNDFYPVEPMSTFENFLNDNMGKIIKAAIQNAVGAWSTEEDTSTSIPKTFHYFAPYYHIDPGTTATFYGSINIDCTAVTAVARGTVTSPTIAYPATFKPRLPVLSEKLEEVPNPYL